MKLTLAAERGKALLQTLADDGTVTEHGAIPTARTLFELPDDATVKLVGQDNSAITVLVINEHAEHALRTTLHNEDGVEEHDILRAGGLRVLGTSKVMDIWDGDYVLMLPVRPTPTP